MQRTISSDQRNTIIAGLEIGDRISFDVLPQALPPGRTTLKLPILPALSLIGPDISDRPLAVTHITLARTATGWERIS